MYIEQIDKYFNRYYCDYGPDGDGSLEYIGMVVKNGEVDSLKEYRRLSNKANENEMVSAYKDSVFFQRIVNFAKIYDFSKRIDEEGKEYLRMVFAPYKNVLANENKIYELLKLCKIESKEKFVKTLIDYYSELQFTGTSPLLKMGVELDCNGNLVETKFYFALRSYDEQNDCYGRRFRYSECKDVVEKSLELLGFTKDEDEFVRISERMEEYGYYPVFTGVNMAKEYSEMKVYYETCFSDYTEENILRSENAILDIMLNDAKGWHSNNEKYIKNGLFLDCLSYSVIKKNEGDSSEIIKDIWKPYYLIYTDALRKARQVDRYHYDIKKVASINLEDYRNVLLVDETDAPIDIVPKLEAHINPKLHRAFSVFLIDKEGRIVIQKRASCKYHSPGLWTNACCSHPITRNICQEASIRVNEELGVSCYDLEEIFSFIYKEEVGRGLTEYEYDHVLVGYVDDEIIMDPKEVEEIKHISLDELKKSVNEEKEKYTAWFIIAISRAIEYLENRCLKYENC